MLVTIALAYKSVCKTYLIIVSDSHDRVNDTVGVFEDFFYNHFHDPGAVHDNIWSDGPSYRVFVVFLGKVSSITQSEAQKSFSWKYFATSHGKVDGIGDKANAFA